MIQQFDLQVLSPSPCRAVRGAEQDLSGSLTVWSLCTDTYLVSSSHPISLEGLSLTDSAEGGPCSELSWVGVLIFLFVSPDCSKVKAGAEITPWAAWPIPLPGFSSASESILLLQELLVHPQRRIQAQHRPLIPTLLNVTLSSPLHINNWRRHSRTPLLVIPFPFAAMNINFSQACQSWREEFHPAVCRPQTISPP